MSKLGPPCQDIARWPQGPATRDRHVVLAWFAGISQLIFIVLGLLLVLMPEPPQVLRDFLLPLFE